MRQLTHKRLTAWLLTLVMALSLLPAAALADEADDGLSPPAPQEDYGYVRLVFSEGEQLDLHHGEYITERSPTAEVFGNASEDFITDGGYAALYYEGRLYHKAALDGVARHHGDGGMIVVPAHGDGAMVFNSEMMNCGWKSPKGSYVQS